MGLDLVIIRVIRQGKNCKSCPRHDLNALDTSMRITGSSSNPMEITNPKLSMPISTWTGTMYYKFLRRQYLKRGPVQFACPIPLLREWHSAVTFFACLALSDICTLPMMRTRFPKRKLVGRNVQYVGIPCIYQRRGLLDGTLDKKEFRHEKATMWC